MVSTYLRPESAVFPTNKARKSHIEWGRLDLVAPSGLVFFETFSLLKQGRQGCE